MSNEAGGPGRTAAGRVTPVVDWTRSTQNIRRQVDLSRNASVRGAASPAFSSEAFADILSRLGTGLGASLPLNLAGLRPVGQRSQLLPARTQVLRSPTPANSWNINTTNIEDLPYADLLIPTAKKHRLNPALAAAVIKAESGFNPLAQSKAGAKGLMQLMDGTARSLGVTDVFDPAQNVDGGVRFLSSLLKRYNGNTSLALAAYNAGPGAVDRYGGIPPYKETRDYVARVLEYWRGYGGNPMASDLV